MKLTLTIHIAKNRLNIIQHRITKAEIRNTSFDKIMNMNIV